MKCCKKQQSAHFLTQSAYSKESDNGKFHEMLRCVFGDFFSKNPVVKMGKTGKSGGGGHYVVESGERIAERVHVLNSFL
ncbi:MAG: hypothetical protein LBC20_05840 [Planctomycetaceae bacterium]|jgi:hypothetical protein|nr:hypothetical protein [Planctomycetaceae bacterium]